MKIDYLYYEEVEVKITTLDKSEKNNSGYTHCSMKDCIDAPLGILKFPITELKIHFCKVHEKDTLDMLKVMPDLVKYEINYIEIKQLPQDILDLAKEAGVTEMTCYNDSPEKLEGMRMWLKDIIANPTKYRGKSNGQE